MKKNFLIGLFVVGLFGFVVWMYSQQRKVAYVDTGILMENYKGMKDARKEFQAKVAVYKSNVDSLMKSWEKELKSYEKERIKMTKKERQLKEELLRNKQQQLNNYQQAIQEKAMKEEQSATQSVVNQVNDYVKEYGKEKGYDFIYGANGSGNIVYANDAYNITQELIDGLNSEYGK
jgi:outer membrane protein